jgi:hypothetical protein
MRLRGKDVHGQDFEEIVKTVDISKSGACFITDKDLPVGSEVFLAIPLPATIVRIDKFEQSTEKKYGVFFRQYPPDSTPKK